MVGYVFEVLYYMVYYSLSTILGIIKLTCLTKRMDIVNITLPKIHSASHGLHRDDNMVADVHLSNYFKTLCTKMGHLNQTRTMCDKGSV